MVTLMSRCPATSWAMCGGMPSSSNPTTDTCELGLDWNALPFHRAIRLGPYVEVVFGAVTWNPPTIQRPEAVSLYVGVVTIMASRGKRSVDARDCPSGVVIGGLASLPGEVRHTVPVRLGP